jgi:nucleotide-binding universal stress UspA family protein
VASAIDADLIVIGGQGAGAVASTPLGSVAAEVVEDADRPVLVARCPDVRNVILAVDGSECAKAAVDVVSRWSIFAASQIAVLSVSEPRHVWRRLVACRQPAGPRVGEPISLGPDLEQRAKAESVVQVLRALGRDARPFVRMGDPAGEVTRFAESNGADLIVMGCRGNTSVRRFPLGSVSRDVLIRASSSVLIVPKRVHVDWIYQD